MTKLGKYISVALFSLLFFLLCGLGVIYYAWKIEPSKLTVTHLDIPLKEWAGTDKQMKIVVAGDFHLHPGENARLQRIVNLILEQQPDLVLLMGDYAYGHAREDSMSPVQVAKILAPLAKAIPTMGIIGNHDLYYGSRFFTRELNKVGITMLERKSVLFAANNDSVIQFSGVPDASVQRHIRSNQIPPRLSPLIPMIAVTHSPDAITAIPETTSLTIAGHTHGGQICLPGGIPLTAATQIGTQYAYGNLNYHGKPLLVTRGLGCSVFPFRLFCPPEIMVLTLSAPNSEHESPPIDAVKAPRLLNILKREKHQ